MPNPRPSAWASVGVLVTVLVFSAFGPALAAEQPGQPQVINPAGICSPGEMPTKWLDDLHPPNTIRVMRSKGPNKGHVEVVNFWDYVGVVVRAEYSTGANKPPLWMRIGAITVKQYGWYKAMFWGGGRVTFTNPDGVTTTTQCWDVKDTTGDQIYKPEKWDSATGTWIAGNVPTPANLRAMRETWHITLRKWKAKKNRTRLFLTGYRSGKKLPCGADSTGYKIYQQSLRDCSVKGLTMYETLRRYFEPTYIVDTRSDDVLADSGEWRGDLGVLRSDGGDTQWRLYPGTADGFAPAVVGTIPGVSLSTIVGHGSGNVDPADPSGAADNKLLGDLVMLTNDNKLLVARSNGDGLGAPSSTDVGGAQADGLLVADFNGDLVADAGLLRSTGGGTASLSVMLGQERGFAPAVDWWSGALDLPNVFVATGDVNGDGKADLITRDALGSYLTATSAPSCASFASWGPCPAGDVAASGLGPLTNALVGWGSNEVKNVVGDYDRDGRDDVIVIARDGSTNIKVFGLHARSDGTFADPAELWSGAMSFDAQPVAINVNSDGMADLALVQDGSVTWLRTNERTALPASMTPMTPFTDGALSSSAKAF